MRLPFRYLCIPDMRFQTCALAVAGAIAMGVGCGSEKGSGFGSTGNGSHVSVSTGSGAAASSSTSEFTTSGFSSPGINVGDSGATAPLGVVTTDASMSAVACPAGLQCDVACPNAGTTHLTGRVYDPAGKNPLYNVAVYVPATALQPLPSGVPTGADACSCSALFKSGAVVSTSTAVDGTFTLSNVPVGASVPLVVQIGKWRRLFHVAVSACSANAQPDHSLTLPATVSGPDDSLPDIAVSTGKADSLECLMRRIGLPASEYVAGAGTTGHVHIFSGGATNRMARMTGAGTTEANPMPGAPPSSTSLWASQAQLMPYDIVLLSCEGGETYNANPPVLEAYLNAGGRAFASHYHYSWFSGPLESLQTYAAPADWGTNLATWTIDNNNANGPIGGTIDTILNGSTQPFPKGVALAQWLKLVGALGQNGVPAAELSIYSPRYNALVGPTQTVSQPWIDADPATGANPSTMYFSFDTPVTAARGADGGPPNYCGRAVFSDLHVAGDPSTMDNSPPPDGCIATDLSPQEKALEFMLFDLSSCVVPDTVTPTTILPPPPR